VSGRVIPARLLDLAHRRDAPAPTGNGSPLSGGYIGQTVADLSYLEDTEREKEARDGR
jgi:hypothetical protein